MLFVSGELVQERLTDTKEEGSRSVPTETETDKTKERK